MVTGLGDDFLGRLFHGGSLFSGGHQQRVTELFCRNQSHAVHSVEVDPNIFPINALGEFNKSHTTKIGCEGTAGITGNFC